MGSNKKKVRKAPATTASNSTASHSPSISSITALDYKEQGNAAVANKNYTAAIEAYEKGLALHPDLVLEATLHSNRAQVYLKLENFEAAEKDCHKVVSHSAVAELPPDLIAKAYFRRATAREGRATRGDSDNFKAILRQGAANDLQAALQLTENATTKADMQKTLNRLNLLLQAAKEKEKELVASNKLNGDSKKSKQVTITTPPPSPDQQSLDILRLLQSRKEGLIKQAVTGEAFFLIDWDWWCDWCRYVDFFDSHSRCVSNGDVVHARDQTVLHYLPEGALLPNDEEDEEEDAAIPVEVPGPIDNSLLFLAGEEKSTQSWYTRQWYPVADSTSLRPNLVRGYHYEILPREVYCALRSWYGEVTPSICRRTDENGILSLYPRRLHSNQRSTCAARCNACQRIGATAKCTRCNVAHYCERSCQESHWPFHKAQCKLIAESSAESAITTIALTSGRVGLNNLGNTCFMNSALQCLSHATPLTRHFLSNKFKLDLNLNNPLGTGGKLAYAYEVVMKDIWMKAGSTNTSPTALKRAIALFAPRFAGFQQHDAQEFLAYLLDGLHEDMNRIRQAPYVEMPDFSDRENMAVAGARAWDAHRRRNDSLVRDAFYGQFKSTCVCPKCNRVSVAFDAFNHISLEIPQEKNRIIPVNVLIWRAACEEKPIRYSAALRASSPISLLRKELAAMVGIDMENLMLCEILENSISDIPKENRSIASIRPTDLLVAYEVAPFLEKTCHLIATHRLVGLTPDSTGKVPIEQFGIPIMTSFPSDLTCRQVWEHVWKSVRRMVVRDGEDDARARSLLCIRLNNGGSKPMRVFPVETPDSDSPVMLTALLPPERDEPLIKFLGPDAVEGFIFVWLEWKDVSRTPEEDNGLPCIDEDRFLAFADHPSVLEINSKHSVSLLSSRVTLDQCFETFTKPEQLDENNTWYCSKCKEHVRAMKTMELWRLPNVLIIHLKRFEFKNVLRRDKLDTLVDFPLDGLDMRVHCPSWTECPFVNDNVPAIYDLFAVTNHYGRMGFGHYTAFARQWDESGISDGWDLFDDSSVKSVGQGKDTVVSAAAYVLFYRRRTFN